MSASTDGIQGFADGDIPALTDASEFRDIPLEGVQRSTDFSPDSFDTPDSNHEQLVARTAAVVANDGEVTAVTETQETAARSYNAFTTTAVAGTAAFPGEYVQLLGADPNRARALISNGHSEQAIVIGPLASIQAGAGFILPPFNVFDPQVQEAIYACVPASATGQNVPVGVWVEVNA